MKDQEATRMLANLNYEGPFYAQLDWIRAVAALANSLQEEMRRICSGPKSTHRPAPVHAACGRALRMVHEQHRLSSGTLHFLPVGTTSHEGLHAEISRWFKQTQQLHQATLELKLSMLQLGKLLSSNRALYHPGTRHMTQGEVLARATREAIGTIEAWDACCVELGQELRTRLTADTPFSRPDLRSRRTSEGPLRKDWPHPLIRATKRHRATQTVERCDSRWFYVAGEYPCTMAPDVYVHTGSLLQFKVQSSWKHQNIKCPVLEQYCFRSFIHSSSWQQ